MLLYTDLMLNQFFFFFFFFLWRVLIWVCTVCLWDARLIWVKPEHDKTNKKAYVPSQDSDQPVLTDPAESSLSALGLAEDPRHLSCEQRRLIRLGGCPDWAESSLGALVILLILTVLTLGKAYNLLYITLSLYPLLMVNVCTLKCRWARLWIFCTTLK